MFSFFQSRISPPGFKIYMPLSSDIGVERYLCQINIWDLANWKFELSPKICANQVNRISQSTGAIKGKWTLGNSPFPLNEAMDLVEHSPVSVSSCDSAIYTLEEARLFMPGEESQINAEIIAERMKTNLILEGKLIPPPCRDYEGDLAIFFHAMAIKEERERARLTVLGRVKETLHSRLARDAPKGWEHLHPIIYDGQQEYHGFKKFPRYHANQRAYLVTREFRDGIYIATAIRNLSACSQREIVRLLEGIEDQGRDDIIYVANQGEEIPYYFESEDPDFIEWIGTRLV
ncbi:unnamed protein product [Fusarium graminearum]|uniref:Uncharacterized protein n=1 Tax=Gibberella zeae TaxID=5518 RepID=A0A2H3FVL0_GIBZA|nr:hypothetical protein FG05_30371 [Fusarium graminearum]KAI6761198.1 hypothetical protein HG531_001751 [Fusarium graminearum]PCD22406.1 hypothetical protein FGRA07_03776 [Fusarium graminearum]CAF3551239.1 unnamed protein product [Fusarium graminearum]CAF3600823.1 unnamed protein product [Fusarium graminearum]